MKYVPFIASAFLLIGILPLPIGYYTFLRLVVFISAGAFAWMEYEARESLTLWAIILGLLALFFNPIVPVYLHNQIAWKVIDSISAAIMIVYGVLYIKKGTE